MNKLWVEQIENPAIVYQENQPSQDFTDESDSIKAWDLYGEKVLQYIQVRGILWNLLLVKVKPDFSLWPQLPIEEKIIAAEWGLADYTRRLEVITDEEDKFFFTILLQENSGIKKEDLIGRIRIIEEMREWVGLNYFRTEKISKKNVDDFYSSAKDLLLDYQGTNSISFKWWLNNTIGTIYENDGFAQKSYYDINIVNGLNDIYNGNY